MMGCEGRRLTALPDHYHAVNCYNICIPVHEMGPSQAAGGECEEERSVWCKHREASAAHRKAVKDKLYLQHRAHKIRVYF